MKKINLVYAIFPILIILGTLTSCSNDDDEPIPSVITISNETGSRTLYRFRVVFVTAKGETLTDKEYGTFSPGENLSPEIPTGAVEYYMATYINNWFFSPNYPISITTNKLTYEGVGQWAANN